MGREVRRVPANWQHPKRSDGKYIPLLDAFNEVAMEWDKDYENWSKHNPGAKDFAYEEYIGPKPQKENYLPDWPENLRTYYQMYEAVTEGTPISPVMKSPEELAHWLADNRASAMGGTPATYWQWLGMIKIGSAPSAVVVVTENGYDIKSGVEMVSDEKAARGGK
jgi:hypothetical protein